MPREGVEPAGPLFREIFWRDPVQAARTLRAEGPVFFLDSSSTDPKLGRYSYLASARHLFAESENNFDQVGELLKKYRVQPLPKLPPFQGGVAGCLSYEFGACLDPYPVRRHSALPDSTFFVCDPVMAWDHLEKKCYLFSVGFPAMNQNAAHRAKENLDRFQAIINQASPPSAYPDLPPLEWKSPYTPEEYQFKVTGVVESIRAGDLFQANLARPFRAKLPPSTDSFGLYLRLRAHNPAPFSLFVDLPQGAILGSSPERFISVRDNVAETRPIKGTRPRGDNREEDRRLAQELLASEKDRAENLMIVDLLRNDLSRTCGAGSVTVPELFKLESYARVHHLVSTVRGRLREGLDAIDLLKGCFPGGSITGAPKLRACRLLHELEDVARGPYCGSVFWASFGGDFDSCINIRTPARYGDTLEFFTGGGITADSDPKREYEETNNKASAIFSAFPGTVASDSAGFEDKGRDGDESSPIVEPAFRYRRPGDADTLIVDNYDSFTENLVHLVELCGRRAKVVRNDRLCDFENLEVGLRHVILSPGPDDPAKAGCCEDLIRFLAGKPRPLLGVCLGHQALGTAFGAHLRRSPPRHGKNSPIHHDSTGIFAGLPAPFSATRYHSLCVDEETLPAELEVTAKSDEGIVMAIQHLSLPFFGLQFHPEAWLSEHGLKLLENFLCRE